MAIRSVGQRSGGLAGVIAELAKQEKDVVGQLRCTTGPLAPTASAYADALERLESARATAARPGASKEDRDALGDATKAKEDAFLAYGRAILGSRQERESALRSVFESPRRAGPKLS